MDKPYLLGMLAIKPDPKFEIVGEQEHSIQLREECHPGTNLTLKQDTKHWPGLTIAASIDEARRTGMEWALELCPREEGWRCHQVQVDGAGEQKHAR
jgi:hypothetical protein